MRDEMTKKASELLNEFVEADEKKNSFIVIVTDDNGVTISLNGMEQTLVTAIAYSLAKKDSSGQIIHKAMKINLRMMI
jgi:hypothetical protein